MIVRNTLEIGFSLDDITVGQLGSYQLLSDINTGEVESLIHEGLLHLCILAKKQRLDPDVAMLPVAQWARIFPAAMCWYRQVAASVNKYRRLHESVNEANYSNTYQAGKNYGSHF